MNVGWFRFRVADNEDRARAVENRQSKQSTAPHARNLH